MKANLARLEAEHAREVAELEAARAQAAADKEARVTRRRENKAMRFEDMKARTSGSHLEMMCRRIEKGQTPAYLQQIYDDYYREEIVRLKELRKKMRRDAKAALLRERQTMR